MSKEEPKTIGKWNFCCIFNRKRKFKNVLSVNENCLFTKQVAIQY